MSETPLEKAARAADHSPPNNARLIAELQAVTLGIHLVGLDRLPEVMGRNARPETGGYFPKENETQWIDHILRGGETG